MHMLYWCKRPETSSWSDEPRHDKTNKMSVSPAKTRIILGIHPVWSVSSLCAHWVAKDPNFLHADIETLIDWADAQADLGLRWAHSYFVGFVMSRLRCHELLSEIMWAATWQNQQNECASNEDSDQPGHPPSLIRVFAIRMKAWVFSYPLSAQQRFLSDWADAQADLSLRWAHSHFVGFFMSRII